MNWSTVRLISFREIRDLLRDRRTIFIITILPVLLYPLLGLIGYHLTIGLAERPSVVGIDGVEHLPPLKPNSAGFSPLPWVAWFSVLSADPAMGGCGGVQQFIGATVMGQRLRERYDLPPLLVDGQLPRIYFENDRAAKGLLIVAVNRDDLTPLEQRQVDLIVAVPPDFVAELERGGRPTMHVKTGEFNESTNLADRRFNGAVNHWKKLTRRVRLLRAGLPPEYDEPFDLDDPQRDKPLEQRAGDELTKVLARLFPFLIVTWSLAGALYPAIDLCAGEKERGTMETLLISPATRQEIVWGKFLAIWFCSACTALWNLITLAGSGVLMSSFLPYPLVRLPGMVWCVILVLPLSCLFSAISLALGAYARSTKEGQYYLMPLFLVTMPLVFLTLIPGVELNLYYSLVPITGTALLLHKLMIAESLDQIPWLYFIPVLSVMGLLCWFALRWAVHQFQREDVLFHEAERIELWYWIKRLIVEEE